MKIALFHNFMDNIGGAEIVTLTLSRELGADIYTTNFSPEHIIKMGFEDVLPRIYSIGQVPVNAPFRHQLTFWRFSRLNLGSTYDFYIISGDWAMSAANHHKPNMWYVHSPLNELWEFKDFVRNKVLSAWQRPLYDIWVYINRKYTLKYSRKIDTFVCNSINTKDRLTKYYGIDAEVIHPPVYTKEYTHGESKGYWLSVNRIIRHKRIEIQMKAFSKLPNEKLIIVGSYERGAKQFEGYKSEIEKLKPNNVEIINWADKDKLIDLYAKCKGVITTSMNEDFGMTVIEAMASGKPVIAPREGGYKETIHNGDNGILIDDINEDKLISAIKTIEDELSKKPLSYKEKCADRSREFDTDIFMQKIRNKINI